MLVYEFAAGKVREICPPAVPRHQDVLRLQVTVVHALGMPVRNCIKQLQEYVGHESTLPPACAPSKDPIQQVSVKRIVGDEAFGRRAEVVNHNGLAP